MSEKKLANSCPTCGLLSLHPKEPQTKRTARVEELLRCNNPPLDAELTDFRLLAKKGLEIFQDLDEKIVLAREMLDNLLQARSEAESHLADVKSLIHPMRSLPYEVVSEIFSHCVPTWTMDESSTKTLDPRSAPWTLTRVCSRWRHIALSMSTLWTYMGLNFEEVDGDTSHQMLRVFLERSKGLPLSVYLFSFREIDEHPLFHDLAATIPRWKQLKISIPLVSWPSLSGNIFSSLETLVQSYNADIDWEVATDISTFNLASVPVLRAFKADPYAPWDVFDHIHLPWSKFIRVINVPTDDIDAYKYLEQMTNLEELTVLVMNPGEPIWRIPVSLRSLLRLTLREREDPDAKDLQSFFSILEIPALFDLRLDFQSGIHHFPRLQPTTQDRLTNLSISCAMIRNPHNVQNLLRFLSDTPRVEKFQLVDKE